MNNQIERVHYYEREYLRSFDFIAEQNYHIGMRRRLNRALHLWGIVEGLGVIQADTVKGSPDEFFISPGMAIDAYGREIFLFAPYTLSEDDIQANRIITPGRYSLWIGYDRQQSTPPTPGYRVCDLPDQYTRWRESYSIKLLLEDTTEAAEPSLTDEWPDDPKKAPWLVRLGSVQIDETNQELLITKAWPKKRVYVGIRAQRIVAPVATLGEGAPDANRPIKVEADLRAAKNLIVGKDFQIDTSKVKPPPTESPFPSARGNLKVKHDLFLYGKLYARDQNDWLDLQQYIQRLMPEIQVGAHTIPTPANGPHQGTEPISVTASMPSVGKAQMMVALSKVQWVDKNTFNNWRANHAAAPVKLEVSLSPAAPQINGKQVVFNVDWNVEPQSTTGLNFTDSITVSYIAILYP